MITCPCLRRKYSPPRSNLAKILAMNRTETNLKNIPRNYQLPSIEDLLKKENEPQNLPKEKDFAYTQNENTNEQPKIMKKENTLFNGYNLNFNFNTNTDTTEKTVQSQVPTPRLGFSIKRNLSPQKTNFCERGQRTKLSPKYRSPSAILQPKPLPLFLDEKTLTEPSIELFNDSRLVYPDGHMSPVNNSRN